MPVIAITTKILYIRAHNGASTQCPAPGSLFDLWTKTPTTSVSQLGMIPFLFYPQFILLKLGKEVTRLGHL